MNKKNGRRKNLIFLFSFIFLFNILLVSSLGVNIKTSTPSSSSINYSGICFSNGTNCPLGNSSVVDSKYLNVSGSNANQNINISGYTFGSGGFYVNGNDGSGLFNNPDLEWGYSPNLDGNSIFWTDSTERMVIDSDGNVSVDTNTLFVDAVNDRVGIGTTSPSEKLSIIVPQATVSNAITFGLYTDSYLGRIGYDGTNYAAYLATTGASDIRFDPDSTATMIIKATSGNVGIGTVTPSQKLDVNGTIYGREGFSDVYYTSNAGKIGGLVGWYVAESFDDSLNVWYDVSGNRNTATGSRGNPVSYTYTIPKNGATKAFRTVAGNTTDGITFPSSILPFNYTLFHVARYNGTEQRIFDGVGVNWLSGFHAGNAGVAFHTGWITPISELHQTNWVLSTDQNNLYRSQGVTRGNTGAGVPNSSQLTINYGTAEYSDWEVAEVIVYNRTLTNEEIYEVENYLAEKYGITAISYVQNRLDVNNSVNISGSGASLILPDGTRIFSNSSFNGNSSANITGAGTSGNVTKWTGTGNLGNSILYDNGTNIGIGTTTPTSKLDVNGNAVFGGDVTPSLNNTYNLGNTTNYWNNIFVNNLIGLNNISLRNNAKVGGVIKSNFSDGNNSGTVETALFLNTLNPNTLLNNGDMIRASYTIVSLGSATATSQYKIYLNGTTIYDSGALGFSLQTDTELIIKMIRESNSVVRVTVSASTTTASAIPYVDYSRVTGLNLSNANLINITGTRAGVGASTHDINGAMGVVEFLPSAN